MSAQGFFIGTITMLHLYLCKQIDVLLYIKCLKYHNKIRVNAENKRNEAKNGLYNW